MRFQDKVVVVTGASSGIGKATAISLAKTGATVVIVCRDEKRGEAALNEIKKSGNESVSLMVADLASQKSICRLVRDFRRNYNRLDVLINNAGVFLARRALTEDGIESAFAINHLAPFLLTNLLIDVLRSSAPSRIVNVSSSAHYRGRIDFDDIQGEINYSGIKAYSQSKLANVLFTYELARRLEGSGVTANCLHPGAVRTNLVRLDSGIYGLIWKMLGPLMPGAEKGADTCIYLASSPEVESISGKYFVKRRNVVSSEESYNEAIAKKLWQVSAELTGLEQT